MKKSGYRLVCCLAAALLGVSSASGSEFQITADSFTVANQLNVSSATFYQARTTAPPNPASATQLTTPGGMYFDGTYYNVWDRNALAWVRLATGTVSGTGGGWTDTGSVVQLATPTDTIGSTGAGVTVSTHLIVSAGNVGIGTASPARKLTLYEGTAASTQEIRMDGNTSTVHRLAWDLGNKYLEYSQVTGKMTLANAGSSDFVLSNVGNVGIGTTGPVKKLDIQGQDPVIQLKNTGSGTQAWTINNGFNTANDGKFVIRDETNSVAALTILPTSGNVGIGTTSPTSTMTVTGPAAITTFQNNTNLGVLVLGAAGVTDYSGIDFAGNGNTNPNARIGVIAQAGGSLMQFGTSDNYASGITNTAMTINASGNVGIGTTNPANKLDVVNPGDVTIGVRNSATTGFSRLLVRNDLDAAAYGDLIQYGSAELGSFFGNPRANRVMLYAGGASSEGLLLGVQTAKPLVLGTNNTERMRIDSAGNVGIGTALPVGKFDIVGSGAGTQLLSIRDLLGGSFGIDLQGVGLTSRAAFKRSSGGAPSVEVMSIPLDGANAGNVGIGTTAPGSLLDIATNGALGLRVQGTNPNAMFRLGNTNAGGDSLDIEAETAGVQFEVNDADVMKLSDTGNVGIGTTNPGQTLEVNGGARLNTAQAQPACVAAVRGTFWVFQGGAGVKDRAEVCAKDAADAYAWRVLY